MCMCACVCMCVCMCGSGIGESLRVMLWSPSQLFPNFDHDWDEECPFLPHLVECLVKSGGAALGGDPFPPLPPSMSLAVWLQLAWIRLVWWIHPTGKEGGPWHSALLRLSGETACSELTNHNHPATLLRCCSVFILEQPLNLMC